MNFGPQTDKNSAFIFLVPLCRCYVLLRRLSGQYLRNKTRYRPPEHGVENLVVSFLVYKCRKI